MVTKAMQAGLRVTEGEPIEGFDSDPAAREVSYGGQI
jgi:hypothetical protein